MKKVKPLAEIRSYKYHILSLQKKDDVEIEIDRIAGVAKQFLNRKAETTRIFFLDCLISYIMRIIPWVLSTIFLDFVIHGGFQNFLLKWMTQENHLLHTFPVQTQCYVEVFDPSGRGHE